MDVVIGFAAELWEHEGDAPWFFVTVPPEESEEIRELAPERRGFGSVRVEVEVGESRWRTSLFPDSKRGCYVLPVKKSVRVAEDLEEGETIDVAVRLLVE